MPDREFDLPEFFHRTLVNENNPAPPSDLLKRAVGWRDKYNISPACADKKGLNLLVIDMQIDFCFPSGSLYVAGRSGLGALEDLRRTTEFIYRKLGCISRIFCSMDTHYPHHIFFPSAHLCRNGHHPPAYTTITADEYRGGVYRANPDMALCLEKADVAFWLKNEYEELNKLFIRYCETLEKTGRKKLYLWPNHCLVGSNGHRLPLLLETARLFHSYVRGARNAFLFKGENSLSEYYSIFRPEVEFKKLRGGTKKKAIDKITRIFQGCDYLAVAGEPSSHCVLETLKDLKIFLDRERLKKVYVLKDCMSPVVIPGGADFTDETEMAFEELKDAGMNFVNSTDPIAAWPGMRL